MITKLKQLCSGTVLLSAVIFLPLPFWPGGCEDFLEGTADFFDDVSDELDDLADGDDDFEDFIDDVHDLFD